MKFLELAMLRSDDANRSGDRTHDHRLGLDDILPEDNAVEHGAGGHPGCGKQAVAANHVLDLVDLARVGYSHPRRALDLFRRIENQAALHLAAEAPHSG